MGFLDGRTETELHRLVVTDKVCPLSGQIEPIEVVINELEIYQFPYARTIRKKPEVRFYQQSTGKPIGSFKMTDELKALRKAYQAEYSPVPRAGVKLTIFGKFCTFIFAIAVLYLVGLFVYTIAFARPAEQKLIEQVITAKPKVGDRYFGVINGNVPVLGGDKYVTLWGWIRIAEVSDNGEFGIQFSNDCRADYAPSSEFNHDLFGEEIYHVTIGEQTRKFQLDFKGTEFAFTTMITKGQDPEASKIPAP